MSLTFHWFLPTYGDSRHVVGGGHGTARRRLPAGPAADRRLPDARSPAPPRTWASSGALTPTGAWCEDAWLTTAMLGQHTERLKFLVAFRPGFVSPDPRRADGRHLPAAYRRTAAAQRRHRRREPRAAGLRRLPGQGRPLRAAPANSWTIVTGVVGGQDRRLHGRAPPGRGRAAGPGARPGARRSTSAAPPRPPARSPPATPTSTSPGASRPPQVAREDRLDPGAGRRARAGPCGSASGCT